MITLLNANIRSVVQLSICPENGSFLGRWLRYLTVLCKFHAENSDNENANQKIDMRFNPPHDSSRVTYIVDNI